MIRNFEIQIFFFLFKIQQYLILREKMYNQSTLFSSFTNGNMGLFYPNYSLLVQQSMKNSFYGNCFNFNSLIYYAVSIDFKKFQTQFLISQYKNNLFNGQNSQKDVQQDSLNKIAENNKENNQKNSDAKSHKLQNKPQEVISDNLSKNDKLQLRQRVLTSDESSEDKAVEDYTINLNKNNDKKYKKITKPEKIRQLPKVDLIDFAFIRKDPLSRDDIEKRKNSLLSRQVQNWNQMQKSRRNQKLQLRRIKY